MFSVWTPVVDFCLDFSWIYTRLPVGLSTIYGYTGARNTATVTILSSLGGAA